MAIHPKLTWFVTTAGKRVISPNTAQVSDVKTAEMEEAIVVLSTSKEEMTEEMHNGVAKTIVQGLATGVVNLVIWQ